MLAKISRICSEEVNMELLKRRDTVPWTLDSSRYLYPIRGVKAHMSPSSHPWVVVKERNAQYASHLRWCTFQKGAAWQETNLPEIIMVYFGVDQRRIEINARAPGK